MGFGCNVPAIMATRTIEDRKSRLITMLVNPLMSCSARLPIYLVMIGAFFPNCASFMLLCIYTAGILLAVIMARIFSKFLVKGEDSPFVMELPPYRMPTSKSITLAASDEGLAGCFIGSFDAEKCFDDFVKNERYTPVAVVAIGEPTEEPPMRERRPMDEVVDLIGTPED